ncbi:MAG: hypothetical protein F9K40_21845 [Kofleriaceae bacterium]|nr:MAG: hypothetical protein F9K40_21845 [Kofleriaceae bacterium]MBZ0238819.1 hypothetical protein [Kofleriaceae bacterium]
MLSRWLVAGAAPAIEAALASIAPARNNPIAVIGDARLARALASHGRTVTLTAVDAAATSTKKLPPSVTVVDALPDRGAAAVIGCGAGERDDWVETLETWSRAVVDGGGLVLVDRAPAIELSRRALCAGLTALEQRVAGRWIVTSGLVCDL